MATTPIVLKYPFDKTGTNPNNLVMRELHTLPSGGNRAIVPWHGPFYATSVEILDTQTGKGLQPGLQFQAVEMYQEATQKTGKEICAALVITDPTVSDEVELKYQVVGGEFSYSTDGLLQMLENANLDERPVKWGDIISKPTAFTPAPHLHDIGDTFGWEYIIEALEQVRYAIRTGDDAAHEALRDYIDHVQEEMEDALQAHMDDKDNPHQTTKAQVGLGSVKNYPIASRTQAVLGRDHSSYMTPLRTKEAIDVQAISPLNSHKSDRSNPHRVSKSQVGLGRVNNTSDMSKPVSTAQRSAINAHANRRDNPHGVTAAQANTYTKSETLSLLDQRLHKDATAVNSHRLQGKSVAQIVSSGVSQALSTANSRYASKNHSHSQYALKGHSHYVPDGPDGGSSCPAYDPCDGRG